MLHNANIFVIEEMILHLKFLRFLRFLTGIGLIPYITVVGVAVVAGGGAVALQYRRPSDSRLIFAAESMHEALAWKVEEKPLHLFLAAIEVSNRRV